MVTKAEQQKSDLIETVAGRALTSTSALLVPDGASAEGRAELQRFVRAFYANVPPEDILRETAENLLGAAAALWRFGLQRQPGAPKIRAYNPRLEEEGWGSSRSVFEIVNDDMPFLVDSVSAELNRLSSTVGSEAWNSRDLKSRPH